MSSDWSTHLTNIWHVRRRRVSVVRRWSPCPHYLDPVVDIVGDVLTGVLTPRHLLIVSMVAEVHVQVMKSDGGMRSASSPAPGLELPHKVEPVDSNAKTQHYQQERNQAT